MDSLDRWIKTYNTGKNKKNSFKVISLSPEDTTFVKDCRNIRWEKVKRKGCPMCKYTLDRSEIEYIDSETFMKNLMDDIKKNALKHGLLDEENKDEEK